MMQKPPSHFPSDALSIFAAKLWHHGLLFAILVCWGVPAIGAERPIRFGWIDRFASGSFSEKQVAALRPHLVGYDPLSCPEQHVVLRPVPTADISVDPRTLRGVCGADVQIPEAFELSPRARLYRGVICDDRRPGHDSRRKWLDQSRRRSEKDGSPVVNMPLLSPGRLPSDVVVCIDRDDNWQIGCDWNANLSFEPTELFSIPAAELDTPIMVSSAGTAVVLRADGVAPERAPQLQILCINPPRSRGRPDDRGQAMIADVAVELSRDDINLSRDDINENVEWVLLPTGRGAADVAAAMAAAERADCDAVLVNLDRLLHWPTDAARLLADLSRQTKLPVVATRRTPISPGYVVEPARCSIPDLAEIQFLQSKPDALAFSQAVGKLIADLPQFCDATQAVVLAGAPTQPDSYVESTAGKLASDRFVEIVNSDRCVAQVPRDAVDGRVDMLQREARFDDVGVTLYDAQAMRVTGTRHSNGVRFDSMPPAQAMHARGGYVLAEQSLLYRGHSATTLSDDVRLRWTRPSDVAATMKEFSNVGKDPGTGRGQGTRPDNWIIEPSYRVDRLRRVDTNEVPPYVKEIASGLTERGPAVVSWWYHEPPRHGSIAYHHLFQDEFSGPRQLPNDRLQFWVVYENGRLLPGYRSIGDLGGSDPSDAWILVQAAITDDISEAAPPKLLQAAPVDDRVHGDLDWQPIAPAIACSESAPQNTATLDHNREALPREDHFLLAELRPRDWEAPGYGWLWASKPQHRIEPMAWLKYYDDDAVQAAIDKQKSLGRTAAQIVANTPRPDDTSKDIGAWHTYLLAIDQAEVRKQRLDDTVNTARRVLELCSERLGGLPSPEPPYYDDFLAGIGRAVPPESDAPEAPPVFQFQSSPQWQQVYAWAVDAAYRMTRAIGYRELPEVIAEHPIADQAAQDDAYETAFFQLCGLVEITDPRFALTLRRYHHRRNEPVEAYEVLTRYGYEGPATPWYFKKERDLWQQSGVTSLTRLGHARWFLHQSGQPIRQVYP